MFYPNNYELMHPINRVITVSGNGKVAIQPNYVLSQIEVSTQGEDVSGAQQKNATIMNRVIQSILALNIPREDIQTAAYNIFPNYDFIEGKQVFRGYEVTNAITVKVKDIGQIGNVIDTAVQNGANRISRIQFGVENADIFYQEALRLALRDAQTKAKTIADSMKLTLHPQPIEIVEESVGEPVPFKSVAMAEQSLATPIERGKITISAAVRVKFQY
ncbi:hypothetical protein C7437_102106 [Psychrobacillus insolitus]|uniref:Secreted protein n=1 Tax=Psychrobacillus insolitus TaxID=1461 RepID=A0A2W7MGI8_9BACI|nr:SIMPL domain-containing protein [Psychrobacillus insolitus]PZX05648.1 hypothetical protein C7437_102106 [Psychrobacillus insolitus]